MKKSIILALALVLLIAVAGTAHAIPLAIGGGVTPEGSDSPGGDPITSMTASFTGIFGRIAGTVTQNVLKNPTGILFEYIIQSTGEGAITEASASFFDAFSTNVDGQTKPLTPHVDTISRGVDGETVTWSYTDDSILTGENSGKLWVQTNAPWYAQGGFSLLGADTATKVMFGPSSVVPEPCSTALLGIGLVGMVARKLRNKFMA